MDANQFVEKQIDLNKDVLQVLKITKRQTEIQNEINRTVATHIDNQAARIKSLEQLVYVTTVATVIEIILITIILAGK